MRGTVTRLRGVPPTVAVRDRDLVYVGEGQLTALASHPLHVPKPPRGRCEAGPTVTLRADADAAVVHLGEGPDGVGLDARTRMVNWPITRPVVTGQRVRATTSRCARGNYADAVRFLEPRLEPDRYLVNFRPPGAGVPWWGVVSIVIGAGIALAVLLLVVAITRALRRLAR